MEGFEPSSKHGTNPLSTRLSLLWLSVHGFGQSYHPKHLFSINVVGDKRPVTYPSRYIYTTISDHLGIPVSG